VKVESSEIIDLLNQIEKILDRLTSLAHNKQKFVVTGDCAGLEAVLAEEMEVIWGLKDLEEFTGPNGDFFLGDILNREEYSATKVRLSQKASALRRLNEQNQRLISKSMEIVQYELGLFLPKDDYFKTRELAPIAFDQKV